MADSKAFLEELKRRVPKTLASTLGIELKELTPQRVVATMPVDDRTRQPFGILHGGASVALAETVASIAGTMNVDLDKYNVVGVEINANHIKAKRDGVVTGTATPIHVGRSTQVWQIVIIDEEGKTVCISRCTLAVVPKTAG
jgi:1,4-dihydroxy-2-naphthoyl-CoA hydrolase